MKAVLLALGIFFNIVSAGGYAFSAIAPAAHQAEINQAVLDAPRPDPDFTPKADLVKIYLARGHAAGALGEIDRQLQELKDGIALVGPQDPLSYELYHAAGSVLSEMGDWVGSRTLHEQALEVTTNRGRKFFQANFLAAIAARLLDKESAKKYLAMAEDLYVAVRETNKDWPRFRDLWEAALYDAKGNVSGMLGYLKETEANYRTCATAIRAYLAKNPKAPAMTYYYLPQCLSRAMEFASIVGKVREAGAYIDDAREAARVFAQKQNRPLFEITRVARPVARVYLEQGLIKEGKSLLESTIAQLQKLPGGDAGIQVGDARHLLGYLEMAQGHWLKAEEIFKSWRDGLRANKQQADQSGTVSVEWGYTLLRLGRTDEALKMLGEILKFREGYSDENSVRLWEGRAFHALALGASGQKDTAVRTLSVAVPKILDFRRDKNTAGEEGYLASARMSWLLDGYISLLADMHQRRSRLDGLEPIGAAFRMADTARGSKVQKALSAAIVRANISDPQSAAVFRRAQDLEHRVKTLSESLAILQDAGPDPGNTVANVQAELVRVREENEKAQAELKLKMPDYTELLEPKALTLGEAQKLLRPGEALVSLYTTQSKTLVWAMTAQGEPSFNVADLSQAAVLETVTKLRKSLDPSEADVNRLPTFEFATAHDLYRKLLAPVERGWQGAKQLIVVPHGALSELPLSVLITSAFKPTQGRVPLAEHAGAPWLIKQAAISYLPSLTSLASLRTARTQPASKSFIGFGDPLFKDRQPLGVSSARIASRGIIRRNPTTPGAARQASQVQRRSSHLELLEPLPDTSEEVREIAKILRADQEKGVNLGRQASEHLVKTADLSQYRIVMFATHGLVAGELPELSQPALALSNPELTRENEDGLLTLAEILELKLRADWVVLSACNTASPDGQAAEAVSGLGRAFFFAGAKALLVSHWPVETVSAKLLTTELFKRQAADSKLSRAQAVRDASLAVMQQSAKPDRGQPYSYAHPMFWAPFVIVGDGGR